VQNTSNYYWDLELVHERLDVTMTEAFESVWARREKEGVHMRLAAYLVAVERVAQSVRDRGWL